MAIQIPNPGTGNGATGDNEFVLWSKVKDNFSNQTHAASRLVGKSAGNLVEMTTSMGIAGTGIGAESPRYEWDSTKTLQKNMPNISIKTLSSANSFSDSAALAAKIGAAVAGSFVQIGYDVSRGYGQFLFGMYRQNRFFIGTALDPSVDEVKWDELYSTSSKIIYDTTTASGANVVVTATGELRRSTSSERYKDILSDLELDDTAYADAMQLAPIVYRSTAEADNPNYHYYSFSAEALGAYDPAFTLWRDTETVIDDEGIVSEQPLNERIAEGINLNAIVAFLHATNVKQGKLIAEQAEAIATLTNRIDDITVE